MARESYQQTQIPTGVADIPYADYRTIAQGLLKHASSVFMGTVLGAGGAGDTLEGVPFEPALIFAMNPAGATATMHFSAFGAAADHMSFAAAATANANPPVLSGSGNDYDVALPTQMAPDGETLTVVCFGFAEVGGSE